MKFAFTTGPLIPLTRDEKQTARYPLDGIPTGTYVISFTVDGKRYTEKGSCTEVKTFRMVPIQKPWPGFFHAHQHVVS